MTDTDRLNVLDNLVTKRGKPVRWVMTMSKGKIILRETEGLRGLPVRGALECFFGELRTVAEAFHDQARQEDVRASALLFEEQQEALQAESLTCQP